MSFNLTSILEKIQKDINGKNRKDVIESFEEILC